jgi:hypothetical protein
MASPGPLLDDEFALFIVIPAKAGIQGRQNHRLPLDARFRGHDGIG